LDLARYLFCPRAINEGVHIVAREYLRYIPQWNCLMEA
jgi:hypothetical protein